MFCRRWCGKCTLVELCACTMCLWVFSWPSPNRESLFFYQHGNSTVVCLWWTLYIVYFYPDMTIKSYQDLICVTLFPVRNALFVSEVCARSLAHRFEVNGISLSPINPEFFVSRESTVRILWLSTNIYSNRKPRRWLKSRLDLSSRTAECDRLGSQEFTVVGNEDVHCHGRSFPAPFRRFARCFELCLWTSNCLGNVWKQLLPCGAFNHTN